MSFRKKNKQKEEEDMKVSHAKDSQKAKESSAAEQSSPSAQPAQSQQTSDQQSGQESGQPEGSSEETSEEQQKSGDEDEDDSSDDEPVPDGTTAEILRWVGDDTSRAQRALDKEQSNDRPRAGLTGELNKILGT